ncbi:glycoside hydrolase family 131 protein, partial [Hebeloma cylindrosporum]
VAGVLGTSFIYDGRAPLNYTRANLDASVDPYLTVVKGSENASHYTTLLGASERPTPLWNSGRLPIEQVLAVSIDNSSVFVPGGNPQNGFRRTDIIAQKDGSPANLLPLMETGVTVFHFSIKADKKRPLNYTHEYQIVFIEPNDGSHVFGIQLGSPFTNPTGELPVQDAHNFKVLDHALNVLFSTPFTSGCWHNFAVQVDWDNRTLAVLFSKGNMPLKPVTKVVPNSSAAAGTAGQGEFHFGVLKLPLVDPTDTPQNQGDVAHHGIQEGTTEGLLYSGIFVEGVQNGISVG